MHPKHFLAPVVFLDNRSHKPSHIIGDDHVILPSVTVLCGKSPNGLNG